MRGDGIRNCSERANAIVLFYVLSQRADTTFLLPNSEFQFSVEAVDAPKILRTEQFKQECGHLREIAEDIFYSGVQTLVFGALDHYTLVAEKGKFGIRQNTPRMTKSTPGRRREFLLTRCFDVTCGKSAVSPRSCREFPGP